MTALDSVNGETYDLVRTTPIVPPGIPTSTQGMRILFDHTRYALKSTCPDKTGNYNYSTSCSFHLPILPTDTEVARRHAVYAEFEDLNTGQKFWFVSTHLDARHGDTPASEAPYEALRQNQTDTIATTMDTLNTEGLPILIGGDFNSWQNNRVGNGAHDTLIDHGYYDTSAAVARTNFQYSTINHFTLTMTPAAQNVGSRIDMLLIKGATGAASFENVMNVTDPARPSDHNMIVADTVIPSTP